MPYEPGTKEHLEYMHNEIVWPAHVKKLMNFDKCVNLAEGCGSNQRICRTTFDWVNRQDEETLKNTTVIIQWSCEDRYEYYVPTKEEREDFQKRYQVSPLRREDINKKQVQEFISGTSGISDQFYGYPEDIDVKSYIKSNKDKFPNIPDDEKYISASDVINLYNYAKEEGKNDVEAAATVADKIIKTYFNRNILRNQNELVFKGDAPGPEIELYKGAYKPGAEENINEMTLINFYEKYSGVTKGNKPVAISALEANITVSEALQRAPGNNPREKIGNLIGVWHLKHYMTHIQPFTWLLVYKEDGSAGIISYDAIVWEDPLELLERIGKANMKFGIRNDRDGFDIQLK